MFQLQQVEEEGQHMAEEKGREAQQVKEGSELAIPTEKSIRITQNDVLGLSGLSDEEISKLKQQHAAGMIDLKK